jgi:hypothetical protein
MVVPALGDGQVAQETIPAVGLAFAAKNWYNPIRPAEVQR